MAGKVEANKSILNTYHNTSSWGIEENRFKRQGLTEFPGEKSLWTEGTVNANYMKPNEVASAPKWPYRDYEGVSDPTTGFVSAGGDVVRKTGVQQINLDAARSQGSILVPNEVLRAEFTKFRKVGSAPQGIERGIDCMTAWSSKKKDIGYLRAEVAGFATDEEEKRRIPTNEQMVFVPSCGYFLLLNSIFFSLMLILVSSRRP